MTKIRAGLVINLILKLCNVVFKNGIVSGDWKTAVISPLYKDNCKRTN